MPEEKFPPHIVLITENAEEVNRLVQIHRKVTRGKRGRQSGAEVLNKSGIVLLVACWEAFVEEVARQAFKFLLRHAKKPGDFPAKVLALAGKELRNSKDETKIWDLADDGWRDVLRVHERDVIRKHVSPLHVPNTTKVDELFTALLGIKRTSSGWRWQRMSPKQATNTLDRLVALRHEIAHNVKTKTSVQKTAVIYYSHFIKRLAAATSNYLGEFLHGHAGKEPWIPVTYIGHKQKR